MPSVRRIPYDAHEHNGRATMNGKRQHCWYGTLGFMDRWGQDRMNVSQFWRVYCYQAKQQQTDSDSRMRPEASSKIQITFWIVSSFCFLLPGIPFFIPQLEISIPSSSFPHLLHLTVLDNLPTEHICRAGVHTYSCIQTPRKSIPPASKPRTKDRVTAPNSELVTK